MIQNRTLPLRKWTSSTAKVVTAIVAVPLLFFSIPLLMIIAGDILMLPSFIYDHISLKRDFWELQSAKSLWSNKGPSHYALHISFDNTFYECEQEFEVREKQVSQVLSNSCPELIRFVPEERTVEDLFNEIKLTYTDPKCGANGCYCDGYFTYTARYDERMGFPVEMQSKFRLDWGEYLQRGLFAFMGPRMCTAAGALHPHVRVSVTPLG